MCVLQDDPYLMHLGPATELIRYPELRALKLKNPYLVHFGIPLARDSEFWPLFRHELQRQREFGLVQRSRDIWITRKIEKHEGMDARSLGYESVLFPFVLLLGAIGLGFATLIVEILLTWSVKAERVCVTTMYSVSE